ncbi:LCP family protein [uncultured Senegalimassilia sp.]|uniref:LCP family protein n=1 Tax=uncultured Senegalimassilia sp. TaxID=1714350 RepID=UPI0025CF49A0|nr:LCP family protein [uncultured Senegalimassilia sp.]
MAFKKNRRPQANDPLASQVPAGYRPAFTPGSQGPGANNAFRNQAGASQYSRSNPQYSSQRSRKSGKGKKIALGVCCALVVALIGCGTAFAVWYNNVSSQLNTGGKTSEELENINEQLVSTNFNEPFYMMLIGSDKREGDDEGGARSDTNIVVRIDPVSNQATLVSIPRDTMIDIDGYGTNKFNAAYNYGGAAATIREATQLTGVSISHYAEVSFDELIDLVDAVGGVDVVVDERIDDTDADNTTDHPENPRIIIEAGEQHLNGEQALVFARSRAYVDGDFTRTANQRKLIEALVNKVLALPVTELPGVIQAAAKCVTTDMKVSDIVSLAQQFKDDGSLVMYSAMLPSVTGYVDGVSYVFADEDKVTEMMKIVDQGGDPSGITGSTSKLAQKYGAGSSAGGSSTGGAATGSGMYAGNDYATGGTSGYSGGYSASGAGLSSSYGGSTGGYADTSSSASGAGTGGYAGAASTGGSASSYGTGGYATGTGTGASSAY